MRENMIIVGLGAVGGAVATALGGWDYALQSLMVFMGIDYVTGLVVAAVFKKSKKSAYGSLESAAGFKRLIRKVMTLLMVLIANYIDILLGTGFVRYAVIVAFIINELISIMENAGLMGVPVPDILKKIIGILRKK